MEEQTQTEIEKRLKVLKDLNRVIKLTEAMTQVTQIIGRYATEEVKDILKPVFTQLHRNLRRKLDELEKQIITYHILRSGES